MKKKWMNVVLFVMVFGIFACNSNSCDENQAYNKMMALNKVIARMFADGGEGMTQFAAAMQIESGKISELIAQQKVNEACKMADDFAAKYKINLAEEMKGMITMEDLKKDGGKGTGACTLAEAAQKQMALHSLLQAEVDAGRRSSEVFRQFGEDTRSFGEFLTTDPTKACELIDQLKVKYGL